MRSEARALLGALVLLAAPALAADVEALVGPRVGSADLFVSEGTKLYNKKQYAKAAELFLKATRANPSALPPYLQLARSMQSARQLQPACYAYRVYLKAAPEGPDRKKAQAESDQCERKLKAAKNLPPDPAQKYVDGRAAFFGALDRKELLGPSGAADYLRTLVKDGFLGPELGEMASKLGQAAVSQADDVHKKALGSEKLTLEQLRTARPLYGVAAEVGASPADASARMAFLEGLGWLAEKDFPKAETHFSEAAKLDPANKEYVFYRGLSLLQAGDRPGALKILEADLKDDPRTQVLRVALAAQGSPEKGAEALEALLFQARWKAEK